MQGYVIAHDGHATFWPPVSDFFRCMCDVKVQEGSKWQVLYIKNGTSFAFQHILTWIITANSALHGMHPMNTSKAVTSGVLLYSTQAVQYLTNLMSCKDYKHHPSI